MAGVGGYQPPANPAPVSGPGSLSQRTDGGAADKKQPIRSLPDAQYGDNAAFVAQQQGAPVPSEPSVTPATPQLTPDQARAVALRKPTSDFGGPSTMPDVPVTDGAARGPGSGPEALYSNGLSGEGAVSAVLSQLSPYDMTGAVQALLAAAKQRGV